MRILLFFMLGAFSMMGSCDKNNIEPTSKTGYFAGTIQSVEEGNVSTSKGGYIFLEIKYKTPNDSIAVAVVDDISKKDAYKVGDKILFKGEISGSSVTIKRLIGRDIDNSTLKGEVVSIEPNRCGYTAKVKDNEGEVYLALFSISNLGEKYKDFKVGDMVNLSGELWTMMGNLHFTVFGVIEQ